MTDPSNWHIYLYIYIYVHIYSWKPEVYDKCRYILHTWNIWVLVNLWVIGKITIFFGTCSKASSAAMVSATKVRTGGIEERVGPCSTGHPKK